MADLAYTDEAAVRLKVGDVAADLRLDDEAGVPADMLAACVDDASGTIDFYCHRFAPAELAANRWVKATATWLAVRALCERRLNDVPAAVEAECQRRTELLERILEGKAAVPGASTSRRPVTVTNYRVDLDRANNQIRVDPARSTGAGSGYRRPRDTKAPPAE